MLRVVLLLAALLFAASTAWAAPAPMTPGNAALLALADAARLDATTARFTRYLWVQDGDPKAWGALSFAVHSTLYRSATIMPLEAVSPYLIRVNFLSGGGDLSVWEKLAPDPMFHFPDKTQGVLITNGHRLITVPPYQLNGVTYTQKWVPVSVEPLKFATHALPHIQALSDLLGSKCPIVDARYFVVRMLSTANHGFGSGLYYDAVGIRKSQQSGRTDEEQFLEDFFRVDLKRARKDLANARTAILVSGVTGKPRAVEVVRGQAHPLRSDGAVWITHDSKDADTSTPERNPFRELLGYIDQSLDRAREEIGPLRNGHQVYALFNGQGQLQTEVPPDVARWHGVPAPYTDRLIAGIACIECHSRSDNHHGLKPLGNDVLDLYRAGVGPLLDTTDKNGFERLRSEYGGDLGPALDSARDFYADSVFASSRMTVSEASHGVYGLYAGYLLKEVGPKQAAFELGIVADSDAAAAKVLREKLAGTADPYLLLLMIGKGISRQDWAKVYADAMTMVEGSR